MTDRSARSKKTRMTYSRELGPLQLRLLSLMDEGYLSVAQLADELDVSDAVVKRSIRGMGRKLQVPIPQMVGKARAEGIRF